ncbi:MAG: HAD family phosphatase [Oscillospiraceae bacterium]|nr:HAD family phosphatase [Oscillospiraceae bacterium]
MCRIIQKIKAVFFDMDGTVLDTELVHTRALAEAFNACGLKDEVGFLERCIGLNHVRTREIFIREIGTEKEYEQMLALSWKITDELKEKHGIKVKAGFFELADALEKRDVRSYIVTSTFRGRALRDLGEAGILGLFAGFICAGDYEKGKPDPEPYLTALRISGVSADECIAIEDSAAGLTSAAAAGLRCVLIRDMARIPPETAQKAYAELENLNDVIDLIT